MSSIKKTTMLFLSKLISISIFAQQDKTEMADTMRDNGRIYVVVAVVLTILIGLILYIIRLDKKMSRLEKEN